MEIELKRIKRSKLYTEGILRINGTLVTNTIEHSAHLFPTGTYPLNRSSYYAYFGVGNSWRDSLIQHRIIIGDAVIPGVVARSRYYKERIWWRIKKCKTPITLTILDEGCLEVEPICHWLR